MLIALGIGNVPHTKLSDTSYGLWGPVMKCATPVSQHRHPTTDPLTVKETMPFRPCYLHNRFLAFTPKNREFNT